MSELLNKIIDQKIISRIIYGEDPYKKPNDYCVWMRDGSFRYAWMESDEDLKKRVLESLK